MTLSIIQPALFFFTSLTVHQWPDPIPILFDAQTVNRVLCFVYDETYEDEDKDLSSSLFATYLPTSFLYTARSSVTASADSVSLLSASNTAQYISNVSMKFNAKLSNTLGSASGWTILPVSTVPTTVIYFRHSVSEGQFAQTIDQEAAAMKKAFLKMENAVLNFMVVFGLCCSSCPYLSRPCPSFIYIESMFLADNNNNNHHGRFFPQKHGGDKNNNPLPSTLVESGVTQPDDNDFYLCAHAAIKSTARPVHYNVLQFQWPNEKIQTLIYEQSYQYIRATTPVSWCLLFTTLIWCVWGGTELNNLAIYR
jgi:hypothetical protein